jgi:hypothetical protein
MVHPLISFTIGLYIANFSSVIFAAIDNPPRSEELDFFAEHLLEASLDARYLALPWPDSEAPVDKWRPFISVGGADFGGDTGKAKGGLLTIGVEHAFNNKTSFSLLGYYDRFNVSGSNSERILTFGTVNGTPIDIPEHAVLSSPDGRFVHTGLGLVASHRFNETSNLGLSMVAGVLLGRLNVDNYSFDFRLTSGADTGVEGQIEYDGDSSFITPFLGFQYIYEMGSRLNIVPRIGYGKPFPEGELTSQLTAPGVLLTNDSPEHVKNSFGDGFLVLGLLLRDNKTHLEIDVGTIFTFSKFESLKHEGIDDVLLVSITWRR